MHREHRMRKFIFALILLLMMSTPLHAAQGQSDISLAFDKLAKAEKSLKTFRKKIEKIAGSDAKPERVHAMQDMSNMCNTSIMQIHSINSLFSVVNLVNKKKKFNEKEKEVLVQKCKYAIKDIKRRKMFVNDILTQSKDDNLKDYAYILSAQLNIVMKQLNIINNKFH